MYLSKPGVYGDVQRVKILYNKKDSALIQMAESHQAYLGEYFKHFLFKFKFRYCNTQTEFAYFINVNLNNRFHSLGIIFVQSCADIMSIAKFSNANSTPMFFSEFLFLNNHLNLDKPLCLRYSTRI